MNDTHFRLINCFGSVFPSLSPEQVQDASVGSMEAWDSMSTAILIAVVEEDFGIEVGLNELKDFVSFKSILSFLEQRSGLESTSA